MDGKSRLWNSPYVAAAGSCLIGIAIFTADACFEKTKIVGCYQSYHPKAGVYHLKGEVQFDRSRFFLMGFIEWPAVTRTGSFDFWFRDPDDALVRQGAYKPEAVAKARKNLPAWSVSFPAIVVQILIYGAMAWILWAIINTRRARSKAELIAPVLMPPLFATIYFPINERYLVHIFGCGCPCLDDTGRIVYRFNSNDLSSILFALVFAASVACAFAWSRGQPLAARVVYLILAAVFAGASCFFLRPIWM